MSLYSPPMDRSFGRRASVARDPREEMPQKRETVNALLAAILARHLSPALLQAFWRKDNRATMKLRSLGKAINYDLVSCAQRVGDLLAGADQVPLATFYSQGGSLLFELIDDIAPCELPSLDHKLTAERYHYAADARAALLQHSLSTLHSRYQPARNFQNLREAAEWTKVYIALLNQAEEVINATRQLFFLEGEALKKHFEAIHREWQALEDEATGRSQLFQPDWRLMLERAEEQAIAHLVHRAEQLGELMSGEGASKQAPTWLGRVSRHMPRVGALMMTVAGGGALLHPATRTEVAALVHQLPALAAPSSSDSPTSELARWLQTPKGTGRYPLVIPDQAALQELVELMVAHGYARHDTLALFELGSVSEMSQPLTLYVRWNSSGSPLLLPATDDSAPVASQLPQQTTSSAPAAVAGATLPVNSLLVQGNGSFGATVAAVAAPVAPVAPESGELSSHMASTYGSTLYGSISEMPPELQGYFTSTVQQVADFFDVRPGDLIAVLQAENNNAGIRIQQPAVSEAGARGVAQVIARTWNGWSNPQTESHSHNLLEIEQNGGLGFDWSAREQWLQWKAGELPDGALANTNADPDRFENSVAAIARHLVHWELTRDRAASDPAAFERQLGDALSVYNSGRPLSEAKDWVQSAANHKTVGQYVRDAIALAATFPLDITQSASSGASRGVAAPEAQPVAAPASDALRASFREIMDRTFGVSFNDEELGRLIATPEASAALAAVAPEQGADALLHASLAHYRSSAIAAREAGTPLPWPFITDDTTQYGQQLAVAYIGHTLSASELEALVRESGGQPEQMAASLANRSDARLYSAARYRFDTLLQRSARGLPVRTSEVTALMNGPLAGHNPRTMDEAALRQAMGQIETAIQQSEEYRQLHPEVVAPPAPVGQVSFTAMPLQPMPPLIRAFGAPVNYQAGGKHTGIDVANSMVNGEEPLIYAVGQGTVVHVGPLYCANANSCRGGKAIVIDHGGNVYSLYSHNSLASVTVGQVVRGGEMIGRQGNEGYSFGSHLHFEVHTGAPYSGDWTTPFNGGQWEDPMAWLP